MDKYEQLERLSKLLEKGYMTMEEFNIEKKKILGIFSIKENNDIKNKQNFVYSSSKNDLITKTKLFKLCDFTPKFWYENLGLGIITLGIYWYIFAYKRWKFISLLKNKSTNYNGIVFILFLLFSFIVDYNNLYTCILNNGICYKFLLIYFIYVILLSKYFSFFKRGDFILLLVVAAALFIFIPGLSLVLSVVYIDYLIKNKLTEDLKVI